MITRRIKSSRSKNPTRFRINEHYTHRTINILFTTASYRQNRMLVSTGAGTIICFVGCEPCGCDSRGLQGQRYIRKGFSTNSPDDIGIHRD
jgi:hypothetical protein